MRASLAVRAMLAPIRFYQRFISPGLPPTCRYEPTCSSYAGEALLRHGAWQGSWLAVRRISRCHPWHRGGYDPVPPPRERAGHSGSSVLVNLISDGSTGHAQPSTSQSRTLEKAGSPVTLTTDVRTAAAAPPTPRSNAA